MEFPDAFAPLTCMGPTPIVPTTFIATQARVRMSDDALKTLEEKIDQLIDLCAQLNRENRALKEENLGFQQERRDLIAKNELARARVEATLQRLRSMEAAS